MGTVSDTTNFVRKHIIAIIIIWLFALFLIKIISVKTSHQELFTWYNNQGDISKDYACISAWDVAKAIELPGLFTVKPFQNKDTPYFLESLARRYGDASAMPPPHTPGMMIEDWCVGLGYRLHLWASSVTNAFNDDKTNKSWITSNIALTMDSGATVLDSYTVYQKYGSPLAWQYPQWKGWISCRIRAPAFPSWDNGIAQEQIENVYTSQGQPNTQSPYGSFSWGSPFVQTGNLAPFGCLASSCSQDKDKNYCNANTCGHVPTVEGEKSCPAGGTCIIGQPGNQGAYDKHLLLPWTEPQYPDYGDVGSTQYAENNPFIAYNIPASSPVILRFLGYGFDTPDETQTTTGGTTLITYSGGPASDQYTQIAQFLDLVNGGFVKYAENSGKPQAYLENYLFGEYTYEAKGSAMGKPPKPVSQPPCGKGKLVGNMLGGAMGGAGIGAMAVASAGAGPVGLAVGATAVGVGLLSGWASTSSNCGGGADSCLIM